MFFVFDFRVFDESLAEWRDYKDGDWLSSATLTENRMMDRVLVVWNQGTGTFYSTVQE